MQILILYSFIVLICWLLLFFQLYSNYLVIDGSLCNSVVYCDLCYLFSSLLIMSLSSSVSFI